MNPTLKIIRAPAVKVMLNTLECTPMANNQKITPPTRIASERKPITIKQQQQQQQSAILRRSSLTLEFLSPTLSRQT